MSKFNEKEILQHLIKSFPRPQFFPDFSIPENEKQEFLNFLAELHHKGLIEAKFMTSTMVENYGLPIEVSRFLLAKMVEN